MQLKEELNEVSEEGLANLLNALEDLERLVKNLDALFGDMAPVKRTLRKRQEDDDFGMSEGGMGGTVGCFAVVRVFG